MSALSRGIRAAAAVGCVVVGVLPLSGPASGAPHAGTDRPEGDTSSILVDDVAEAWYSTAGQDLPTPLPSAAASVPPLCSLPTGCPPSPAPSQAPTAATVYPPGTLHVESSAGSTTAIAYVVPDLDLLPDDAIIAGGVLVLPINQEPTSGNQGLGRATMVGCLVTSEVTNGVAGQVGGAPTYDCTQVKQPATYRAAAQIYTVDLTRFAKAWAGGAQEYGVALVPDPDPDATASASPSSSPSSGTESDPTGVQPWHVAINGAEVATGARVASLVTYTLPTPSMSPSPSASTSAPPSSAPPLTTGGGGGGGGGVALPAPDPVAVPSGPAEPSTPTATPETTTQPSLVAAPAPLLNRPWYTYRGVVLLPLAFLLAVSLTGRSLTRPLALAVQRRRGTSWRGLGR